MAWHKMDHWYEEEEEVFVHPRDPYKRVDAIPSARHVQVVINGEIVADTHRPTLLFETDLPTRYYLPQAEAREALLNALPPNLYPRLESELPALIEVWRDGDTLQVHLTNYAHEPQRVRVLLETPLSGRCFSPDGEEEVRCEGAEIRVSLDIYKILILTGAAGKP